MTTVVETTTSTQQAPGYPSQPPQQQQGYPQGGYPPPQGSYPPPQGSYPQPQQPVLIQVPAAQQTAGQGGSAKYNGKAGLVTGILQISAGGTLVLLGIIVLVLGTWNRSAWNIWGGLCFYGVAGILGVVSKRKNTCVIVAYMVMSIISAVCAGGQMFYDMGSAIAMSSIRCYNDYEYWNNFNYYHTGICEHQTAIVAMHSLASLAGLFEMVVAIVASAYCCCGVCGKKTPATQMTVVSSYAQPIQQGSTQVTVVGPGSYPAPVPGPYPAPGTYPASGTYPAGPGPYPGPGPYQPQNQPPPAYMEQATAASVPQQHGKSGVPS